MKLDDSPAKSHKRSILTCWDIHVTNRHMISLGCKNTQRTDRFGFPGSEVSTSHASPRLWETAAGLVEAIGQHVFWNPSPWRFSKEPSGFLMPQVHFKWSFDDCNWSSHRWWLVSHLQCQSAGQSGHMESASVAGRQRLVADSESSPRPMLCGVPTKLRREAMLTQAIRKSTHDWVNWSSLSSKELLWWRHVLFHWWLCTAVYRSWNWPKTAGATALI